MGKQVTIRYTTTRGDLLVANISALTHNRFLLVFWAVVIAWVCYAAVRESKIVHQSLGYKIGLCLVMAALYFAFFFCVTVTVTSVMLLLKKNKSVLCEHSLSVTDEGLLEKTAYNESLHRWDVYHKTVSTKSYLLLYVPEGHIHFVSKKRPLSEGDLVAFELALNEKIKNA